MEAMSTEKDEGKIVISEEQKGKMTLLYAMLMRSLVLHELCHVKHRNHSKEFWRLVVKHVPDYKMRVALLEKVNPNFAL